MGVSYSGMISDGFKCLLAIYRFLLNHLCCHKNCVQYETPEGKLLIFISSCIYCLRSLFNAKYHAKFVAMFVVAFPNTIRWIHANKFPTIELSHFTSRVNICKSACNNIVISLAFLTLCQSEWSRKCRRGDFIITPTLSTALIIDYLKSHNSITVAIYKWEVFFRCYLHRLDSVQHTAASAQYIARRLLFTQRKPIRFKRTVM